MILSDGDIDLQIDEGSLKIEKYNIDQLQPASYDLLLDDTIIVDPSSSYEGALKLNRPLKIYPKQFILGSTVEWLSLPNYLVGRVEGKSSLGRIGLAVHITAGYIDPGFRGNITLEMVNLSGSPITLSYKMPICQISFIKMTNNSLWPYGSKRLGSHYQDQKGPTVSCLDPCAA